MRTASKSRFLRKLLDLPIYTKFLETVKGIRVLLLSVSNLNSFRGYLGAKPIFIRGSNRPKDSKSRNRKGVSTLYYNTLLGYFLISYFIGTISTYKVNLIRILTIVRYYLGTNLVILTTLTEFSRLLFKVLSPKNNIKRVGVVSPNAEYISYTALLIALIRRLLRISVKLLAYLTLEGVSSIGLNLGRILLI